MGKRIQQLFLVILLFNIYCSIDPISGTTSSENAKVIGTILDENEMPVDSADVRLRNHKDTLSTLEYDTTVYTNAEGVYVFNIPPIGSYYITAVKDNKRLAYIDSIEVENKEKIPVPTYSIGRTGSVTGIVALSDSVSVSEKAIEIYCEPLDFRQIIRDGNSFTINDVPRGRYPLIITPTSDLHQVKRLWFSIRTDEVKDLDTITLVPKGYYTEEELYSLVESMALEAGKDVRDVFRILSEEGELFGKQWKHEQEEEVKRIIAAAVEKAIDSKL